MRALLRRPPAAVATAAVVASWTFLSVAITSGKGAFNVPAFTLAIAALVLLGWVAATRSGPMLRGDPHSRLVVLAFPAVWVAIGAFIQQRHSSGWFWAGMILAVVAALIAAASVMARFTDRSPTLFWVALTLATAATIATLIARPGPINDVWWFVNQSASATIDGHNMYDQVWSGVPHRPPTVWNFYPYLPWTTILLLPAKLVLTDVRFGLLAAGIATAILLRRRGPGWPALLPLLVLVMPAGQFYYYQSWTEPLLVLGLTVTILAAESGRGLTAVLALALTLACKQHIVLFLPLFALWRPMGWRRTAIGCGLGFVLVAPWLLIDPSRFWYGAVTYNLHMPDRPTALSLGGIMVRHGMNQSLLPMLLAVAAAYVLALRAADGSASRFALGAGLIMTAFVIFNSQSFFNHYTLAMGLIVIALATAPGETPRQLRSTECGSGP